MRRLLLMFALAVLVLGVGAWAGLRRLDAAMAEAECGGPR